MYLSDFVFYYKDFLNMNEYLPILRWMVLVFRYESNCLYEGLRTIGGMAFLGVFLRNPNPYLREFRRKLLKTRLGWLKLGW